MLNCCGFTLSSVTSQGPPTSAKEHLLASKSARVRWRFMFRAATGLHDQDGPRMQVANVPPGVLQLRGVGDVAKASSSLMMCDTGEVFST